MSVLTISYKDGLARIKPYKTESEQIRLCFKFANEKILYYDLLSLDRSSLSAI